MSSPATSVTRNCARPSRFHTLLVGGNPMTTSAIYALIRKLETDGGVWFAEGGTNAAGRAAWSRHFERLGGTVVLGDPVERIETRRRPRDRRAPPQSGLRFEADAVASQCRPRCTAIATCLPAPRRGRSARGGARPQALVAAVCSSSISASRDVAQVSPPHDPVRPALQGLLDRHL